MNIKDITIKNTSRFMKFLEGENIIRIVSGFVVHETSFQGQKPSTKYSCYAIDRSDAEIRICSFGPSLIKQIQALASSTEYGFDEVPNYDITVIREGMGAFDTTYTVRPARKDTPLTEAELEQIRALEPIEAAFAPKQNQYSRPTGTEENSSEVRVEDLPF